MTVIFTLTLKSGFARRTFHFGEASKHADGLVYSDLPVVDAGSEPGGSEDGLLMRRQDGRSESAEGVERRHNDNNRAN